MNQIKGAPMRFELKRNNKPSIFGDLWSNEHSKELLLLMHGFKGFYSWGFLPEIKKRFLAQGVAVLSFNFSMNGVFRHGTEITAFEAFSENNFSTEQDDIADVLNYIHSSEFPVRFSNVYGIGHSRGGAALLVAALDHPDVFCKIATLSAISHIHHRASKDELQLFKKQGYATFINGRTGDELKMNYQFQEDLDAHYARFNILSRLKNLKPPLCIIHGDADETVPLKEAYELKGHLNKATKNDFFIIPTATHTYNFDKENNRLPWQLNEGINRSIQFLLY